MMQRCSRQPSAKVGFVPAVSERAFRRRETRSPDAPVMEYPHFIGNTVFVRRLEVASTGATSQGRTSPDVMIGEPCSMNVLAMEERPTA